MLNMYVYLLVERIALTKLQKNFSRVVSIIRTFPKRILAESECKILNTLASEKDILETESEVNDITTNTTVIEESSRRIMDLDVQLKSFYETISVYEESATYFADLFEILGKYSR